MMHFKDRLPTSRSAIRRTAIVCMSLGVLLLGPSTSVGMAKAQSNTTKSQDDSTGLLGPRWLIDSTNVQNSTTTISTEDPLDAVLHQVVNQSAPPKAQLVSLTRWLAEYYTLGVVHNANSPVEIARSVLTTRLGSCGSLSNTLNVFAERLGFKGRLINLFNVPTLGLGHTVSEIFYNNTWHVFDPTYGVYYRNNKGDVASFEELRHNPNLALNKVNLLAGYDLTERPWQTNAAAKFYTSPYVFRDANPAGVVSPENPMIFPVEVVASSADNSQARLIDFGIKDNSPSDLMKLDGKTPSGLYFIGSAYENHSQFYRFSNLNPKNTYLLRIDFVRPWPSGLRFNAIARTGTLLRGTSFITTTSSKGDRGSVDDHWDVVFSPDGNGSAAILLTHNYTKGNKFVYVDRIIAVVLASLN